MKEFYPITLTILSHLLLIAQSVEAQENTFKDCEDCPEMIVIPSGEAWLGSEPYEANRREFEYPLRKVSIAYSLAVAKTEVTRGQFREFLSKSSYVMPEAPCNTWDHHRLVGFDHNSTWDSPGFVQADDHPVVCVSYYDAVEYAKWLSKKTGESYRLLSATEFEYATRAGTRGPWFWGSRNTNACNYANVADKTFRKLHSYGAVFACDDGYERSSPVAKFEPNPWGLYDMIGNAWEWTEDCKHNTNKDKIPTDGSPWLAEDGGECDRRTPKGGGFLSGTGWVRAGAQARDRIGYRSHMLGFRVARVVE